MMKKILMSFMILFLFSVMAACGNEDAAEDQNKDKSEENATEEKSDENIEIDKGLLNVEVTLPASMFEGQDIDQVIAEAEAEGVKDVTQNDDGSLTYKMSKAKHKEMLQELKTSIEESTNEMKNGEDYPSIKDVTYNKSFTEFTLVVNRGDFENSMDGFATFGLGISGMYYQMFEGVDQEDYKVTIAIKDEETNEVFDTIVYPDDLEELSEEG